MTHYAKLQVFYTAMYDYLKAHPEFDGTAHPDHPAIARKGTDPLLATPWPGVDDVPHMSRDEWVEARLQAIRRGTEVPLMRRRP